MALAKWKKDLKEKANISKTFKASPEEISRLQNIKERKEKRAKRKYLIAQILAIVFLISIVLTTLSNFIFS